jgi:4-aminobutyrate aminotransferase/(S)-3-amino-2-methylpropionate transaminase
MDHFKNYKTLSVMGLEGSSHGNSIATLSCSDKSANKNNSPTFNWPIAPLPQIKYPYTHHTVHNEAEEKRCLEAAKKIIFERKAAG